MVLPYWKYCNWQYVLKCSLESGNNERARSTPSQVAPVRELGLGTRVASDIEVLHLHFTSGHRSKSTNQNAKCGQDLSNNVWSLALLLETLRVSTDLYAIAQISIDSQSNSNNWYIVQVTVAHIAPS